MNKIAKNSSYNIQKSLDIAEKKQIDKYHTSNVKKRK